MNVGGPILVSQSIFSSDSISALVNRALNLYLQWLHICERVSFLTVAHHILCVKKVCTQKWLLFLKDCLTEPKKTIPKLKGSLLGECDFTSKFIPGSVLLFCLALLYHIYIKTLKTKCLCSTYSLALSLYIFFHKPFPQTVWLYQHENFSTIAKLESCYVSKDQASILHLSAQGMITQGRREWKSLKHLQQIWVAICVSKPQLIKNASVKGEIIVTRKEKCHGCSSWAFI